MTFQWDMLQGYTGESIKQRIADETQGPLTIVDIERRPTAQESLLDFYRIVPEAVTKGNYEDNFIPHNAIFQMKGVGVVIRDSHGKKVMGHDSLWDLHAQADNENDHINIWAVHYLGKHVAVAAIPRDRSMSELFMFDTQKFSFRNTNKDITPTIENLDIDYELIFLDLDGGGKEVKKKINEDSTMKTLCTDYAEEQGKDVKSLRYSYAGRPLFLSSVGKKQPASLGLVNMDVILVSSVGSLSDEADVNIAKKKSSNKKVKKHKGKRGNKKKSGPRPVIEVKKSDKEEHSKGKLLTIVFSHVLKEAEPTFKAIRQKLHALTLERTPAKERSVSKKNTDKPQCRPICNPHSEGEGGKAGKPYYLVIVGEVTNLYKTAKGGSCQKQRTRSFDLHGLKSKEALDKLDEQLGTWVSIAMRGSYPFVIPVAIVCGGGSQVLSETVEKWIKSKAEVANAPKTYFG
ncbi:hypothetical protein ACHAXR_003731 [Thalassiosira sp. AJA248-18]